MLNPMDLLRILGRSLFYSAVIVFFASSAAGQVGVSIDPPRIERTVAAGKQINDVIRIRNRGAVPINVTASLADFILGIDGEIRKLPPGTSERSVAPFIRISPIQTTLAPGERFSFRYSISAPPDFKQLGSIIYFTSTPISEQSDEPHVSIGTSMGIGCFIQNPKTEPGRIEVEDLIWSRAENDPSYIEITATLRNTGERNIRPSGFVRIRSSEGSFGTTFEVNRENTVVLPGTSRKLRRRFGPVPLEALDLKTYLSISSRDTVSFDHVVTSGK